MKPKEIKAVKNALEQINELRAYASDVRTIELLNLTGKKAKKKPVPVLGLDSLDEAWMAAVALDNILKSLKKAA